MFEKIFVGFEVNGVARQVETYPMARLLDVLREALSLTGVKEGCGEGECGACSVLLDGELVNSCLVPAIQMEGASIVTIEGFASGENLHPLQEAFISEGGAQCGICTPGMILACAYLLSKNPRPDDQQIRRSLSGNLCRCTGYTRIFRAVEEVAARGEP